MKWWESWALGADLHEVRRAGVQGRAPNPRGLLRGLQGGAVAAVVEVAESLLQRKQLLCVACTHAHTHYTTSCTTLQKHCHSSGA